MKSGSNFGKRPGQAAKKKPSDKLADETNKLEEKLHFLQDLMEKEKGYKRAKGAEGTQWRSASTKKPLMNYSKYVLDHKKAAGAAQKQGVRRVPSSQNKTRPQEKPIMQRANSGTTSSSVSTTNPATDINISTSQIHPPPKPTKKKLLKDSNGENIMEIKTSKGTVMKKEKEDSNESAGIGIENIDVNRSTAAHNIQNALNQQKQDFKEVEEFLGNLNMIKYRERFLDNGIEDLETILELEDEHFKIMNIPLGHKLKMLKRIKQIKVPGAISGSIQTTTSIMTTGSQLEPLPEPAQSQVASSIGKTVSIGEEKPLMLGQFDEKKGHDDFLAAREEWLRGNNNSNSAASDKKKKKVRFSEQNQEKEFEGEPKTTGKSVFLNSENDEWNVNCLPQFEEVSLQTGAKEALTIPIEDKESCWNCYKLFPKNSGFLDQKTQRYYCEESCYDKYVNANAVSCTYSQCENKFLKSEGILSEGLWFCGESCEVKKTQEDEDRKKHLEELKERMKKEEEEVEVSPDKESKNEEEAKREAVNSEEEERLNEKEIQEIEENLLSLEK